MNVDKIKNHIKHLEEQHKELDFSIKEAYNHHDADEKVKELKIKKLQLKKTIEWLNTQVGRQGVEESS